MMRPMVPSSLNRAMKLGLNFLNGATLDSRVTFSRADTQSCATYFGSDGRLATMGANLLWNSGFIGTPGPSSTGYPWGQTGSDSACNSLVADIGIGQATNIGKFRKTATGFQGVQISSGLTFALATYTVSCYLRIPTGVSAAQCSLYLGASAPAQTTIATAATLNAQPKDTWVRYSTTVTITSLGSPQVSFSDPGIGIAGTGWDICCPQWELGSVATTFSLTPVGGPNSGPRLDYDPSAALGTTGVEITTNGNFALVSVEVIQELVHTGTTVFLTQSKRLRAHIR